MFEPDERLIYQFKGRKGEVRCVDPMAAWDRFVEAIGDETPDDLFKAERAARTPPDWPEGEPYMPDKMMIRESRDARRKIVGGLKEAFNVKSVEEDPENGLSQNDMFRIWFDMFGYMDSLKKSTDVTQSTAPPTEEAGR